MIKIKAFSSGVVGLVLLQALLLGCASSSKTAVKANESAAAEPVSDLTWDEAKARKERVSEITYDLKLDLMGALSKEVDAKYTGELELRFKLKDATKPLRIDFAEGELKSFEANGKPQDLAARKKFWIEVPAAALVEGANVLRFSYVETYSRTGEGFFRFRDPVDDRVYLYTQFEPYDANRMLPCFDQPDMRAVLKLSLTAPKDWVVSTSSLETAVKAKGAAREWTFAPSAEISTYLFSVHAGPYAVFKDKYVRADKSVVPLRVFVRESLKGFLKHKDWFKFTKDGMGFYENYFGVHYPFTKLDQLIVPEFNMGGMENAAAITYTEDVLPRSVATRKMRRNLSGLLLHEIAHMWFGDLVTMSWWNDLWLNESFATYMASLSQVEATDYKEGWQTFAGSTKSRAYMEDGMMTTHPIEAPVVRVREAMSNFDAITYEKGASVLKQLNYYMTSDDFRSGIREYFKTYSYKNTTLKQFIGALQNHTKKDLAHWSDRWLRQSGTDQISTAWTCEGDRLKAVDVTLKTLAGRKDRPQSFEVALFKRAGGKSLLQNRVRVDFEGPGETQTQNLKGDWACPDFVYPNHDDHGYVLVKLDTKSLEFLRGGLASVDEVMTRTMIWSDLWRMVRETEISLKTYVEVLEKNFASEKDEVILGQIFRAVDRTLGYWPTTKEAKAEREKFVVTMETEYLRRIKASVSGSDEEKTWYDALTRIAQTPVALGQLAKWYAMGKVSKNFKLDLDRSWTIVVLMTRYQQPKAADYLAQMKKKDASDRGVKAALSAAAVAPAIENKKKWVTEFLGSEPNRARSQAESEAILEFLFPVEQEKMKLEFANDFFKYLEKNRNSEDQLKVETVLRSLDPLVCEGRESKTLKENVNKYADLHPTFKKNFLMSLDEDERCQRIRATSNL